MASSWEALAIMKSLRILRELRDSCRTHAADFSPEAGLLGKTLVEASTATVEHLERVLDAWTEAEASGEIFQHHSRPTESWARPYERSMLERSDDGIDDEV